jgi:tricorn protease
MPVLTPTRRRTLLSALCVFALPVSLVPLAAQSSDSHPELHRGYYTDPAVHGDTVLFVSEGDLWSVGIQGGQAHRLTSSAGSEGKPTISSDGKTVAFRANYEGPTEVYTMPIEGGLPQRRTWDGHSEPEGWSPDGRLMVSTERYSTLPGAQLVLLDNHGTRDLVPLAQAAQGVYSPDGKTLFFTRWFRQWSETKRYKGGWAENLWSFDGVHEAVPLTADYAGASTSPMYADGRIYFLSDRDGVMNVYSMDPQGHDVKQVSHQHIFDVQAASLSGDHIVYTSGSDLWLLDLASGPDSGKERVIPVTLLSDFDQMREHWVKKPFDYLTSVHLSPDGSNAVFTTRGEVFSIPAKTGRTVKVAGDSSVRYREARFLPDGKSIVALSTKTGETEFWKFAANGLAAPEQWTNDAKVLRWQGVPSPDGNWLAHYDKDQQLWLFNVKTKQDKLIATSKTGDFSDLSWSGDSRWLAYSEGAANQYSQLKVLNVASGDIKTLTDDRYNSMNPIWSTDGKWLYFLSDRNLKTTIGGPWGPRQPEPHFDHTVKVYELALTPDERSPFLPADELHPDDAKKDDAKKDDDKKDGDKDKSKDKDSKADAADKKSSDKGDDKDKSADKKEDDKKKPAEVKIDFTDLASRLSEVPAPPGNYGSLQATDKRLCWLNASDDQGEHLSLQCLEVANKGEEIDTVTGDVKNFEISLNRKKLLLAKGNDFFVFDSDVKAGALGDPKAMGKAQINLSHLAISTIPREEFRGIFLDAWRLERDYFYDRHMQGVDWPAMRDRYLPLVDRVANRDELNIVIAQMVSELSALHTFVRGGDERKPSDDIDIATLGAVLHRDEKAGGFLVQHIYAHDPDLPNQAPPFARPESLVKEGEVILSIDGQSLLNVPDERSLLRGKAGQQVLLRVKPATGDPRDVLVTPIKARDDAELRYNEWEYLKRITVDADSDHHIGYVHLRAMGGEDIDQWARDYYPVFDRQGLIIDVRHNHGGNIDSWLLGDLLRKAWFYFQPRVGDPSWNMQYAFRGHIVVLCDQETASDGEAFTEGFKHFELGKVIGTRTWGGEIWLSGSNTQADNGVATAAEIGVYSAEGKWLIEGHGVEPDITVDNPPHATFSGDDAQLTAAINLLKQQIKDDPRPVPQHPPYPDKSFKYQQ